MGQSRPLFNLFSFFQRNITILTSNKCEKCRSSIWRWDSNPQSSEHESTEKAKELFHQSALESNIFLFYRSGLEPSSSVSPEEAKPSQRSSSGGFSRPWASKVYSVTTQLWSKFLQQQQIQQPKCHNILFNSLCVSIMMMKLCKLFCKQISHVNNIVPTTTLLFPIFLQRL